MFCMNPWCPVRGLYAIEQHHLLFRSHEGKDDPENLIPLCVYCHRVLVHCGGNNKMGIRLTGKRWQRLILRYWATKPGFRWQEALDYTVARDFRPPSK